MPVTDFFGRATDGHIWASNAVYLTAWNALTGTVNAGAAQVEVGQATGFFIERGVFFFDTSAIGAGSVINSAILKLLLQTGGATLETYRIMLVAGVTEPLKQADYNRANWSGHYGELAITGAGWKNITLIDFSIIDKAGITALGLRTHDDINGVPPVANEWAGFASGDSANKPVLTVDYTPAASGAPHPAYRKPLSVKPLTGEKPLGPSY